MTEDSKLRLWLKFMRLKCVTCRIQPLLADVRYDHYAACERTSQLPILITMRSNAHI